ncbi:MAG: type II toxin-antitoxin system HicA family toxin [Patescibacteria group bacterium]
MGILRGISGREAIKRFSKLGYVVVGQNGSHVRLRHSINSIQHRSLTIPMKKELKIGLLHQLIQDAGSNVKDFLEL